MKLRFIFFGTLIATAALGQWEAESRVTTNTSAVDATTAGNARAVAMRGDTVHVVYHEGGMLSSIVYYRRSTDRGQTWSSAVQLSAGTAWNVAQFGCIALRGATVHTAWFDLDMLSGLSRILYRRSTNSGTTWSATTTITSAGTLNEVPSLAFSGDTVHLVWDDGGAALYYRRSTDNGASWAASGATIATGAATGAVTAAGPTVLVSYSVGSGSAWDIYLRRSTDAGATWGNAVLIENRGTLADISSLALRGSNAWVAWYDNGSGTNDIRLRRSTDAGATWLAAADLGAGAGNQEAPCLLVTPTDILHAMYDDDSYGNFEISHRFSTDLGVTWSAATRLTNASGTSQRPTLAITGNDSLGVVWTDGRYNESYPDVFFRRGVIRLDVGCSRLLAPTGTIDSNASVTPACSVTNFGAIAASFRVRMKVGSFYNDTARVSALGPGAVQYVTFPANSAWPRGTWGVTCSTELAGDAVSSNDRLTGSITVAVRDVGTIALLAPSGTTDSGTVVTPACSVYNWGTGAQTYWVKMKIGAGYYESTQVSGHAAGSARYATFPNWTALARGNVSVSCSTALAADMKTSNDRRTDSAFVRVIDVRAVAVVMPVGAIPPGPVAPQARFRNDGNRRGPTDVTFAINASPQYQQTVTLTGGLPPGLDTVVQFPSWTAVPGSFRARCSAYTVADVNRANDTAGAAFTVGAPDVGVDAITAPAGVYDTGSTVLPGARLHNYGSAAASFRCWFVLRNPGSTEVYRQFSDVPALAPGADTALGFPGYNVGAATGDWTTRCSVYAAGDSQPANDFRDGGFRVAAGLQWPPGWVEVDNVPLAGSGRSVKDGGWVSTDAGSSLMYVAKGNKTGDFYAYNPFTSTWATLASLPAGAESKLPSKGAAGCSDGNGHIYATKGNNTQGFWTYDAARDSWRPRAGVPLGPSNKKVKGGTDLVYAANGCVYLLKGYKNEFWKYFPTGDSWRALPNAPVGANAKWDKGSWLAYDGARTVFAHKAKYHELAAFDTGGDTWLLAPTRQGMPRSGANGTKKSKDGGSGAYYSGALYALKGGNTQEFWRYRIQSDSWQELDTMPSFGSTGKRKKVKAGGDIASFGNGAFFALKGNKTVEFWRYVMYYAAALPRPDREGVAAERTVPIGDLRLAISPNPLASGFATIRFSSLLSTPFSLRIYDAAGRCVLSQFAFCNLQSAMALDLRGLRPGVYLVRLESGGFTATQKLVVQR